VNFASGVDITAIHAHRYHEEFKFQLKREEKFAIMQAPPKQDAFFDVFVAFPAIQSSLISKDRKISAQRDIGPSVNIVTMETCHS
jgi:hypothetical protein